MRNQWCVWICAVLLCCGLTGCKESTIPAAYKGQDSQDLARSVQGTTLRLSMGTELYHPLAWVDTYLRRELKQRYKISLERTDIPPGQAVVRMTQSTSSILPSNSSQLPDLVWVHGLAFAEVGSGKLGLAITDKAAPNLAKFTDSKWLHPKGWPDPQARVLPLGWCQTVMEYDTDHSLQPPRSIHMLPHWAEEHPGKITFPSPLDTSDPAGLGVLLSIFMAHAENPSALIGYDDALYTSLWDQTRTYLDSIRPYLWKQGTQFPSGAELSSMFSRHAVACSWSVFPGHAQAAILQGTYPRSVRAQSPREGGVYFGHYLVIPRKANNIAAALVAGNFLLSPEAQLAKGHPGLWGDLTVLDVDKLAPDRSHDLDMLDRGPAAPTYASLAGTAQPMPAPLYIQRLLDDWKLWEQQ